MRPNEEGIETEDRPASMVASKLDNDKRTPAMPGLDTKTGRASGSAATKSLQSKA